MIETSVLLDRLQRWRGRLQVAFLLVLAYIPPLLAHPGKLPTDTKLYLYFSPGRLTSDALFSWDSRQFAGWVPHQTISYLWPSGPWYSVFSWLGVPDWIAQRLWIGTLLALGGLGVRWAAKHLGIPATGALVAAMFYQLSPYVLPYISRTSVMLLPWAGLGWMIGLTVRAATRTKWRDIAIFGLIMFTVASVNGTAILMIAPAPVLWLLHAAWGRIITWKRALVTAVKIGAVSVATSVWWIVMLSLQGKFGADVLSYSETVQAVSLTSSSTEVLRGMGYWLFYVRDPWGFTTTASFDYMASGKVIAVSFAVLLIGLVGLTRTRWASRRFAVLLVFVGVVLAVSVHPIDNPSPLLKPLADHSRSGLALALRSSTRALPLSTLGLALGAGALVTALSTSRRRLRRINIRRLAPWAAGGLAILNMPALFNGDLVDPALIRDQNPPAAWTDAAKTLDATPGSRVMQLPGQEFGAYRWGYTVDPPLPGLTTKPLVTRDLLPLGSPAAMDLVYALDDRFQEGTIEASDIAPLARLFGADTLWVPNDVAFDRFRTPRPEVTAALVDQGTNGLGAPKDYGTPQVNTPQLPMVDEQSISNPLVGTALPPVQLVPVQNPLPIMRAKTDAGSVVVAGSGDGVVDAAGAGLIDGTQLLQYSADVLRNTATTIRDAAKVIVTDSNRDRAHQWRGSQDVWGFTEDGSGTGVLRFDSADQRTPVFPDQTTADMTVAEQRGVVTAAASSYGEPNAYLPEDRAAMAVDGDLTTAWVTADRADATGEFLRVRSTKPMTKLTIVQPQDDRNRWITRVDVHDASGSRLVDLTDASRSSSGQVVALASPSSEVTITIEATDHRALRGGEGLDAVGFAEVNAGFGPTEEVVRVPTNVLPAVGASQPVDIVLTRLRTRETNRWRSDPERNIVRSFTLAAPRTFTPTVTARLDLRASDTTIAAVLGWNGTTANRRLTGVPAMGGWAATDGDNSTSWVTPFNEAIGSTLSVPLTRGTPISSLIIRQPMSSQMAVITEVRVDVNGATATVAVPPPDANGDSVITFPAMDGFSLDLTITATNGATTIDRRYAEPVLLPAGISELSGAGIVAAQLPQQFQQTCNTDLLSVDGNSVPLSVSASVADLFAGNAVTASTCGLEKFRTVTANDGEHIVRTAIGVDSGIDIDRIVLQSDAPVVSTAAAAAPPAVTVIDNGRTSRTMQIAPCPTGCWFIFGEGYNTGWTASIAGKSLGTQTRVDGGFNGWYLPPSTTARTIEMTWQGEGTLRLAFLITALALVVCIVLIVRDRKRSDALDDAPPVLTPLWGQPSQRTPFRVFSRATFTTMIAVVSGALVIAPIWGLICGGVTFVCCFVLRRPRVIGYAALAVAAYIALVMVHRVTTEHPFANAGWPAKFEDLHRLGMSVVVFLVATVLANQPRATRAGMGSDSNSP